MTTTRSNRARRGVAVLVAAALAVGGLAAGVLGPASAAKPFTKKAAKQLFYTKKKADARFALSADQRRVPLPGSDAFLIDATYTNANGSQAGIEMPDTGAPTASWDFRLPPDYDPGTQVTVTFLWLVNSTGCNVRLIANTLSIAQLGKAPFGDGGDVGTPDGVVLAAPGMLHQTRTDRFQIPGTVDGNALQPGDSIHFSIYRQRGDATDTCDAVDVLLRSAEVTF